VRSFQNLILKNYEARKAEFYMKAFWHGTKARWLYNGPLRSNGANGNEMQIIFLHGPRLLRWAMWPIGLLFVCLKMKWCKQVFPDPLPIVCDLITDTMKSLDPPLHSCVNLYVQHRDTLAGLIELKQVRTYQVQGQHIIGFMRFYVGTRKLRWIHEYWKTI
jgi:hypothetical protein